MTGFKWLFYASTDNSVSFIDLMKSSCWQSRKALDILTSVAGDDVELKVEGRAFMCQFLTSGISPQIEKQRDEIASRFGCDRIEDILFAFEELPQPEPSSERAKSKITVSSNEPVLCLGALPEAEANYASNESVHLQEVCGIYYQM